MGMFNFWKSDRGSTGIMIALAMVPILLSAGAAIDFLQRNDSDTTLQAATDAAALAGYQSYKKHGRSGKSEAKIKEVVYNYLSANGADKSIEDVKIKKYGFDKEKEVFYVEMAGTVPTTFMHIAGIPSLDATAYSEVKTNSIGLELALVLDTTLSMSRQNRMPTLKRAATDLVNILYKDKDDDQYLKVGLVPFANYVSVGLANRDKPWIDVPPDYQDPPYCYTVNVGVVYGNICTTTTHTYPSCSGGGDGEAPTCTTVTGTSTTCNVLDPGTTEQQCSPGAWHRWHGAVGSRSADTVISGSERYPGPLDVVGSNEITDLTDKKGTLISGINTLSTSGETYIPAGLLWGWNMLAPPEPYSTAKTDAEMAEIKGIKALVLMTDGFNTKSTSGSTHDGSNANDADAKTATLCENIKAQGIVVFTVAFMVKKNETKKMLAKCASDAENVFDAQDDEALETAFYDIATSLKQLYLSQ